MKSYLLFGIYTVSYNSNHDIYMFMFLDLIMQVTDAKLVWIDRLGFDLYIYADEGISTARVPFPREVSDEKGVKSSLNSMFHLAWEVEKGYVVPDFEKIKFVKKINR